MIAQTEVPQSQAAVVEAIDAERRNVREWAERSVREIEDERNAQLAKLDAAAAALTGTAPAAAPASAEPDPPPAPKPAKTKPKARRRPPKGTSPAHAKKRREAVYKLLVEKGEPVASGVIQRELNISQFQAKTAVRRLDEEGKIIRHGEGAATKYEAKVASADPPPPADPPPSPTPPPSGSLGEPETNGHGTLQGRMLQMIEASGGNKLDEIIATLKEPKDVVVRELGKLVKEGEVKIARKAGATVYVPGN